MATPACTVYTDNQALKSLLKTPHPSGKLACSGLALQDMDLTIKYPAGRSNRNADALSRNPLDKEPESATGVSASVPVDVGLLAVEPSRDGVSAPDVVDISGAQDTSMGVRAPQITNNVIGGVSAPPKLCAEFSCIHCIVCNNHALLNSIGQDEETLREEQL